MSRASDRAIALFRQSRGPLRCLAASDPCGRRPTDRKAPPPPADTAGRAHPENEENA